MCLEYSKRYNKAHASEGLVMVCEAQEKYLDFLYHRKSEFVQAMPEQAKKKDPIQGYRNFYNLYKFAFARWRKMRPAPEWYVGGPKGDLTYANNSPLKAEMNKPPLKLVKYHNYGLKKLKRNKLRC